MDGVLETAFGVQVTHRQLSCADAGLLLALQPPLFVALLPLFRLVPDPLHLLQQSCLLILKQSFLVKDHVIVIIIIISLIIIIITICYHHHYYSYQQLHMELCPCLTDIDTVSETWLL